MEVFIRNEKLAEIFSRAPGISDPIDECLNEFDNKFLEFTGKNIQFGIKKGIFRDLPVIPIASSTLAMIKYAVFKWVVNKDITEAEMIDMVISFHQSLAIGLVKNNSCRNNVWGGFAMGQSTNNDSRKIEDLNQEEWPVLLSIWVIVWPCIIPYGFGK